MCARIAPALCFVSLASCAAARPPPASSGSPAVVAVSPVPANGKCDPMPPVPPSRPHASLCWARGRPTPPSPPRDEYCNAIDAIDLANVEARVRKQLAVDPRWNKLVVDFGCDHTIGQIDEVVFEDGSGHGGSLRIARVRRGPASATIREIAYRHYYNIGLDIRAGEVPLPAFNGALAGSHVALLARPHVISLAARDGSMPAIGFTWSSNDFHILLSLTDEQGGLTERHFTGYESSDMQSEITPMRMAADPWVKLLAGAPLGVVTADEEDRHFFTARLIRTFANQPGWWIAERYVALAATLGTIDAVPTLVGLLGKSGSNASDERLRDGALQAIAAITGWDPRADPETHGTRPPAEAAKAAMAECAL
jgi:hypothetical protein